MTSALDERYGTRDPQRRMERWGYLVAAVLVLGVIGFWALSTFGPNATAQVSTSVVNFRVADDGQHVQVDYIVTVDPGTELSCALEATSKQSAVVGWLVVDLEASAEPSRALSNEIATVQTASTVVVKECWVR